MHAPAIGLAAELILEGMAASMHVGALSLRWFAGRYRAAEAAMF